MHFARTALVVLTVAGCSAKYSQVPPRLDLQRYGRVAVLPFEGRGADTSFASLATHRFAEEVLAGQGGIELLELGETDPLVRAYRQNGDVSALAAALSKEKNVAAVFLGQLTVSDIKPTVKLNAAGVRGRASVNTDLAVRMLSTQSGGTLWRSSFSATSTIGNLSLSRGLPSIVVRDPEDAYGEAVRILVGGVTRDLRPSLVRVSMAQPYDPALLQGE